MGLFGKKKDGSHSCCCSGSCTGEDMARLRRLHDELSRSEPSEAPDGGADDDGGDST